MNDATKCPKCGCDWEDEVGLDEDRHVPGGPRCLRRQIAELERENTALKAIVDRLPHTADGVVVWSGDEVWFPGLATPLILQDTGMAIDAENGAEVGECYSTKEAAAEAAKERS